MMEEYFSCYEFSFNFRECKENWVNLLRIKDTVKMIVSKDGMFERVYLIDAGEKGREAYERIVARVKKDLPEGFTLESEFDEESGRVTLKISGPGDKETPKEIVKKIADSIRDETKEKKE